VKYYTTAGRLIYLHINPFQGFKSVDWAGPLAGVRGYSYFATLWQSKNKKVFIGGFLMWCEKAYPKSGLK
jgi:hypothetical protein